MLTLPRKVPLLLSLALLGLLGGMDQPVQAQTGTVTDPTEGTPLPGINVAVVGPQQGGATNANGRFEISGVPVQVETGENELHVALASGAVALENVVVTALGIEREQRSLGYAAEEVDGGAIEETGQPDLLNALSGTVSGVTITNAGGAGGSVRASSFGG